MIILYQNYVEKCMGKKLQKKRGWGNVGRFDRITCSPRKVSRFAPLNRYYVIVDDVFFDNFLVIIYLLVVYKKNNNIKIKSK